MAAQYVNASLDGLMRSAIRDDAQIDWIVDFVTNL